MIHWSKVIQLKQVYMHYKTVSQECCLLLSGAKCGSCDMFAHSAVTGLISSRNGWSIYLVLFLDTRFFTLCDRHIPPTSHTEPVREKPDRFHDVKAALL